MADVEPEEGEQFTEIFFHKNVTDFFTPAPAERLHHPLRLSLEMGFK